MTTISWNSASDVFRERQHRAGRHLRRQVLEPVVDAVDRDGLVVAVRAVRRGRRRRVGGRSAGWRPPVAVVVSLGVVVVVTAAGGERQGQDAGDREGGEAPTGASGDMHGKQFLQWCFVGRTARHGRPRWATMRPPTWSARVKHVHGLRRATAHRSDVLVREPPHRPRMLSQAFGSRGRPSRRSPMMLRWTWLVPPAMRPAGAASSPAVSGPVEHRARRRPCRRAATATLEHHLGDAQLEQRAAGRGDRPPSSRWRWASAL